ncbi:MAG: hypothetical protein JRI36_07300 [Deltaproteobacteria bacterium]|nr:hypothetical protein [Deltaproteobacteria bacterium]
MGERQEKSKLFQDLADLYAEMEAAYNLVADGLGLSCDGCPDNCCTSFFQHHTRVEWAYLWEGLRACAEDRQKRFLKKAADYVEKSRLTLSQGGTPKIMCPLNEDGRCRLYTHRLMICRLHGVPNRFTRPDGKIMRFPGCTICQRLYTDMEQTPVLDRTAFYKRLASLEMAYTGGRPRPGVRLTLAEMLVYGPPE